MSKNLPKLLSKTKLLRGYQCAKSLYLSVHHKELEPPVTPELQAIFDQGNRVGEKAREYFPKGVLIENPAWDFFGALKKTRELIREETEVIFEAAFEYRGCFARADVISYNHHSKRWSITEVKSTTKVKDEHYDDVGLQVWIMAQAGLPIEKISVWHLNPACRYPNLQNLFLEVDVTDVLRQKYLQISPRLNQLFEDLRGEEVPQIEVGPHCSRPNECGFYSHCFSALNLPEKNIFMIPGLRDKKWEFFEQKIWDLKDTRLEEKFSELTEVQVKAIQSHIKNERWIDFEKIKESLKTWQFPLYFLDFETINPAIPEFDQTSPYQQVPFQWSVHKMPSLDSEKIEHFEFLSDQPGDHRLQLIEKMIEACGERGSIVAYYSQFESARLSELAEFAPQYHDQLESIRNRLVDPLPIFRDAIYDPQFMDSYSLKSVGPAILGEQFSYDQLLVQDGLQAQRAYAEMISSKTTLVRKKELHQAILEYCQMDTWVMVRLVQWMMGLNNI